MTKGVHKTHRVGESDGDFRWIEKPPSKVLRCPCTNRYIKTRWGQKKCVPCLYGHKGGSHSRYR